MLLEQSVDSYRAVGDREGEARVLAQAGQAHYQRGTSEEGITALRTFLDSIQERDRQAVSSHSLASVYAALALLFFATGRYDEQLSTADDAALLARAAANERLLARVEVSRALALLALGNREEAHRVLEGAIPLAEAAGDLQSLARALDNLSNVHYFRGEFDRSRQYLERGLEVAEQMGDPAMIGHMLFMLGTNAFWVGNWSKSRAYFERDTVIVRTLGKTRISALPLYGLGQLSLYEGDWEAATGYLEEVVQLAEQSGNIPILKWAHRMLAERQLRERDPEAALARLTPLLKFPGLEHSATLLAPLAEALTQLGREAEAESAVAEAITRATADDDRIDLAHALRASAALAIRQQRWEDALHTLGQAVDLAREMNYPYGHADYLSMYGSVFKQRGAVEEARQWFQEALTIFRRLGAKKDVERMIAAIGQ
jgi:tetratricopeptide (TPR) repeat protein